MRARAIAALAAAALGLVPAAAAAPAPRPAVALASTAAVRAGGSVGVALSGLTPGRSYALSALVAGARAIALPLVRKGREREAFTGDDAGKARGRLRYERDLVQVVQALAPPGTSTVKATLRLGTAKGKQVASTALRLVVLRATIDPPTSPDGNGIVTTLRGVVAGGRYGLHVVVDTPGGCAPQSAGDPLSVGSPEQRIELVDLARDLGRLCSLPPRTVVIGHLELRTTITGTSVVLASSAPFEVVTP